MSSLQFHPLFSLPVLLIAAFGILVFLLVLEKRRRSKFFVVNALLQIIVVTALLGLATRPYFDKEIDRESVILLTNNYDESIVDSLSSTLASSQILHRESENSFKKSSLLESFDVLQGMNVYVVGDGITYYDLEEVVANEIHFFPSAIRTGVQSLQQKGTSTINRSGKIIGKIYNPGANTTLFLNGPEGVLDSIHYSASGHNTFELKFRPKVVGDYIYQLEQKDSIGKILFSEPLPVSVLAERKLSILLLQDFPSVELKFLKNYLGEKGHSIAIRYGVSKNINRSEFVNRPSESLDRISLSLLEKFDLIVVSADAFDNMPVSTQQVLAQSIKEGLGLVLLINNDPSKSVKELLQLEFIKIDQDTTWINFKDEGNFSFPVATVRVTPEDNVSPVLANPTSIVEGFVSKGSGKIGFQLLQESYPLLLSANQNAYAQVWTPLLEVVARKELQSNQLKIITPFPWYEDEPLEVQLMSANTNPNLKLNGVQIPLIEDARIDGIWTTTIWAKFSGWNQLAVEDDSTKLNFYVSKNDEWKSLRAVNQVAKNKWHTVSSSNEGRENRMNKDEISPLVFFIVFLFASGALWLIPKL